MNIKKHIPNSLTSANLFLGTLATFFAILGKPHLSVWCLFAGAIFDFTDGFAARMLKAYSPIGKDLDSLADLISFGFAPAAIFSSMLLKFYTGQWGGDFFELDRTHQIITVSPFILTIFSGLRLAKFNNDERQTENFIGLTTTATGIFTASLLAFIHPLEDQHTLFLNPGFILPLVGLLSLLLVSEVPMFSLKFKSIQWNENKHRFILIGFSAIAIALFQVGAATFIIPFYVFYSLILNTLNRRK